MDPAALKENLIAVLGQIQADSDPRMPDADRHHQADREPAKVRQQGLAYRDHDPCYQDRRDHPRRREHLRRRNDQAPALHRRDSRIRLRLAQEAKRAGSGRGMTKLDSAKRAQIAERLKEARKLAGLSQGHVAKMLGLHRPSVSEMEAGNRRVSADELARLAEIYDVSVVWLLGEAPETLDAQDPRLELAARELAKLKPDDLVRLLRLLAAMRSDSTATEGDR